MAWFDLASGRHSSLPQGFTSSGESRTLSIPRPGRVWGRIFCTQDPTGKKIHVLQVVRRVCWLCWWCEVFVDPSFSLFYAQHMWTVSLSE
ncbi:hypothetical protein NC651_011460 [Populus alba x Populus x berolinensis]|nr:hypothetical protein NC651_011460 [Populus alba x Populus x berolinensis]